jgi:flagellin
MGLRIQTNMASVNAQRNTRVNSAELERSMERLSSGYRINKSMDDVAGLAISERAKGAIKGIGQAERNAQDGISFVQVAEGGLSETSNILTRMRELATQAASDTIGSVERGFVNVEVQQLKAELDRIAETTEFSGTKLLNGSGRTLDFQIGIRGTENDYISFDAGKADGRTDSLGVSGIDVAEKTSARQVLEDVDGAISKVAEARAGFGAIQSRMNTTVNNLQVYKENISAANSRIRDADMATEASNLARSNVLQNAGVAVMAQANNANNLALKLL